MKIKNGLNKLFLAIYFLIFVTIFLGTIFDNKSIIAVINPAILILSFVLTTLLFIVIYKYMMKTIDDNISLQKEIFIAGIIIILLISFQGVYSFYMASLPEWDWGDVLNSAKLFVERNYSAINWTYFELFPNNNGILYLEIVLFKALDLFHLFNSKSVLIASILSNVFLIDLSILFLYLTVRNLFGKKQALFSLIICIFNYAFYCYIPVFYTDTITMFFPILIIFLYSNFLKKGKLRNILLIVFFSLIGYKLKPTVLIVLIAIFIDIILRYRFKESFKSIITLIVSFIVMFFLMSFVESKLTVLPYDINHNSKEIPYTHWVMMGMTERESYNPKRDFIGWYNPESLDYTLKYKNTSERKKANIKKIKKQFKEYGFKNYSLFLYRKLLFTWSDGTYYAPALVDKNNIYKGKNLLKEFTEFSGKYVNILFIQNIGMILFLYFFMIAGVLKSLVCSRNQLTYAYITIFGLLLFLLLWEDSSRYLITYIPVILLCTIAGVNDIIKAKERNICEKKEFVVINRGGNMKKEPILYIAVPCYNEEEVLEETTKQLKTKMEKLIKTKKISAKSKVMYINDGSKDKTWNIIKEIHNREKLFTGITLSRNRGHQNALLGGLMTAKKYADIVISMDADLQDDINAIDEMIEKYKEGNDIVYGVRSARKKDTFFKRATAEGFYKFMQFLGVDCVYNHADYRLTSKRVLEELENFKEVNLFLRGMFPLVGFKTSVVYYERNERFAGESKYPLKKMLNFAWDGITSFSVKPLRFICTLGFLILFISIFIMFYSLVRYCGGNTVNGWTFLSISIWFIGGIQMICLGIIGEYIGKMYSETKARPRFIISENLEEM